ncbi:DUF4233 domain-containing protein [Nocardioides sp. Kera G14]|uniref:DUF4233 domain-containing protein n=1 Tax=Nocardioides sp. Kera G14 TaxID=2884264 RepID=UPI001D117749|nr:DUF4233 domain-containing protein [Nocardioides sp. Kera G14]UDY24489.1 DUF4233 domain-containing protein [Nocardioides sp. Kera G14]
MTDYEQSNDLSPLDSAIDPERTKSPRRGMCAAVLSLEAITLGLTTPVMISVHDVSTGTAVLIGVGLLVLCVGCAGMLRRPWAYYVGWAIQVAAVALGAVVGIMVVLGLIFGLLWGMADLLGRRIERERAAAFAAYDAAR